MKSVFFAVPAYRGVRCVPFFESLDRTVRYCEAQGWQASLSVLQGCCYVQVARNELVNHFLKSGCEYLFFLDDDLGWDCKDALKLLEMDDDIVCGVYPNKTDEERYPVVINTISEQGHVPVVREDGCISAVFVPTGFLRIKRQVIDKMIQAYPELRYTNIDSESMSHYELYDLFPQGVFNGRWWGEDFAFCRLWHQLGGEIWLVPDINFNHYDFDNKSFQGNYHRYLLRQPGGSEWDGQHEHPYEGNFIEGWMTIKEQRWLYDQAKRHDIIAEIGSFKGKSSHAIISAAPQRVHCVDFWGPYLPDETEEMAEERYNLFLQNIKNIRNGTDVRIHRKKSVEAADDFWDNSIDLTFIDASHDYEDVKADIKAWLPKTRKVLCGHDHDWPGVKKAVKELLGEVEVFGTIWIYPIGGKDESKTVSQELS